MKPSIILYPILFSVWIVLGAYVPYLEIGEVQFEDISRALFLVPVCTLIAWGGIGLLLKDWKLSALLVWVSLMMLFTYKAQYTFVRELVPLLGSVFVGVIPFLIWLAMCLLIYRIKTCSVEAIKVLNMAGACLLAIPLFTILTSSIDPIPFGGSSAVAGSRPHVVLSEIPHQKNESRPPNIIYIILDGYGRDDVLRDMYGFDNSAFLSKLRDQGFYVATKSRSNYAQTTLSLASSLNFQYLNDLPVQLGVETNDRRPLRKLIHQNKLVKTLKGHGYETVAFSSGISYTELWEADSFLISTPALNEWESFLLLQSPIPDAMRNIFSYSLYDAHKSRLLYVYENLPKVIIHSRPQFIFAHFVAPHPPFVLGHQDRAWQQANPFSFRDGSEYRLHYKVNSHEYRQRYVEQLKSLNQYIQSALDAIVSEAQRPTVIIVQSDHGPGSDLDWGDPMNTSFRERMSILNAFYMPEGEHIGLYPDISPVNTFRMILNHYFQEGLPLLQDESYFSTMDKPYDFIRVTETIESEGRV